MPTASAMQEQTERLTVEEGLLLCSVHKLSDRLAREQVGQQLWHTTGGRFQATLRRYLALLDVPSANQFTLKSFRAGRATALAAAGKSVGSILAAGEWRSRAFLRYVDEEVVDTAQRLHKTLEDSDNEDEVSSL